MIDTPTEAAIGDKAARDLLEVEKLRALNAKLLEALKNIILDYTPRDGSDFRALAAAKAAIKQAEEL